MNWKRLAGFSLLLNAVVPAWVFANGQKAGAGRDSRVSEPAGESLSPQPKSPLPVSGVRKFEWSQIESTNYLEYIANLRSIACPEQTIHDIVSADVAATLRNGASVDSPTRIDETWRHDPEQLVSDLMGGSGVREYRPSARELAVAPDRYFDDRGGHPGPQITGGVPNGSPLFASVNNDPAADAAHEIARNDVPATDRDPVSPEVARQQWIATYLRTRYGQQMWNSVQQDSGPLGGDVNAVLERHKIFIPEPPERRLPVPQ